MAAIRLSDVTVEYPLYAANEKSLRSMLIGATIGGRVHSGRRGVSYTRALNQVTLSVGSGERLAVLGRNGSGKSTLLKVVAGIYEPTQGRCVIDGAVGSIFNIYHGMEDELTGRSFYFARGYFLGLSRRTLEAHEEEARSFSGLHEYFDLPLRTYSDGMRLRLAFTVATMSSPEILLLDEVFGTGDKEFFGKAMERMTRMADQAGVTLFATHWLELAEQLCTRAVWLDRGEIRAQGEIGEVLAVYRETFDQVHTAGDEHASA